MFNNPFTKGGLIKPRKLFTDGSNSFWHFFFGVLSYYYKWIIPLFVLYQLMNYRDKNLFIDLLEFFIGFIFILLLSKNK